MARPAQSEHDKVIETWEVTTEGTVWVWQYDRREDRYQKVRVGGRAGSRRLHISRDDRKFNQEQVVEEMSGHDPFTNGVLRLLDSGSRDETLDARYHLTEDDLKAILEEKDESAFAERVAGITSELVLRRLSAVADKHASMWQVEFIRGVIDERYKAGGTQRTVREMIEAGERVAGNRL